MPKMTSITVTKMMEQKVEVPVDSRIYDEQCKAYRIADVIFDRRLDSIINCLYNEENYIVEASAERINKTFAMADAIMEICDEKPSHS